MPDSTTPCDPLKLMKEVCVALEIDHLLVQRVVLVMDACDENQMVAVYIKQWPTQDQADALARPLQTGTLLKEVKPEVVEDVVVDENGNVFVEGKK